MSIACYVRTSRRAYCCPPRNEWQRRSPLGDSPAKDGLLTYPKTYTCRHSDPVRRLWMVTAWDGYESRQAGTSHFYQSARFPSQHTCYQLSIQSLWFLHHSIMADAGSLSIALFDNVGLTNAYISRQQHCGDNHNLEAIKSAANYVDFCINQDTRDLSYPQVAKSQRVATRYGHLLHPSTPDDYEYCPVCVVLPYLQVLRHVASAWYLLGGSRNPVSRLYDL